MSVDELELEIKELKEREEHFRHLRQDKEAQLRKLLFKKNLKRTHS